MQSIITPRPKLPGHGETPQRPPWTAVITKTKPQTKRPSLYCVLLLNDDYTPMEFVLHVLERFFNKDRDTAQRIDDACARTRYRRMWYLYL